MRNKHLEILLNKNNLYQLSDMIPKTDNSEALLEFFTQIKPEELNKINLPIINVDETYVRHNEFGYIVNIFSFADILQKIEFNEAYNWNTNTPEKIYNFFISKGMRLTSGGKKIYIQAKDIDIFNVICQDNNPNKIERILKLNCEQIDYSSYIDAPIYKQNDNKIYYLVNKGLEELGIDGYRELIAKKDFLKCLIKNNYTTSISLLLEKSVINIDDKIDGNKLIFFSSSEKMLDVFLNNGADIYDKNSDGESLINWFTNNLEIEKSKPMVKKCQKLMAELAKNDNNLKISNKDEYKKTLLNLFKSNRTKKDIQEYIKSSNLNIDELYDIVDSEGNNLKQICILNDAWAKLDMFLDLDNAHINNYGLNVLDLLFLRKNPSNPKRATDIYLKLSEVSHITPNSIIENLFNNSEYIKLPMWINQENLIDFIKTLRIEDESYFSEIKANFRNARNNFEHRTNITPIIKDTINILDYLSKKLDEEITLKNFDFSGLVETEHVTFGLNEQDKIHFDDAKILNLKLLCEYSNNFKKEISELLELESKNIIDIFDSYLSKIKPENSYQRNDFYNKSNFLVELMLEVYNKDILAYLTDEVITEYNKVNPNIEIIYRTQILNNELGSKNKISKKLKI